MNGWTVDDLERLNEIMENITEDSTAVHEMVDDCERHKWPMRYRPEVLDVLEVHADGLRTLRRLLEITPERVREVANVTGKA